MLNKNKFNKIKNKKGFTGVPNKILSLNLDSQTFHVFFYYVSCTEEYNPSVRTVAKTLNLAPSTVVKINKHLENAGLIKKIEQGTVILEKGKAAGGKVTKYSLCHPDNWKPLEPKKRVRLY